MSQTRRVLRPAICLALTGLAVILFVALVAAVMPRPASGGGSDAATAIEVGAASAAPAMSGHGQAARCAAGPKRLGGGVEGRIGALLDAGPVRLAQATNLQAVPQTGGSQEGDAERGRSALTGHLARPDIAAIEAAREDAQAALSQSRQAQIAATQAERIALRDAQRTLVAVSRYDGRDAVVMSELLARVDTASDRLFEVLTGPDASPGLKTTAFACNAMRRECKAGCEAEKGQTCCCGCGVSFLACLVLD